MTALSITEFDEVGRHGLGGPTPTGQVLNSVVQNITFTTTSTQSAAFAANTQLVRVVASTDVRILWGTNPTSVATTSMLLPAGDVEYFGVPKGQSFKVAAVDAI